MVFGHFLNIKLWCCNLKEKNEVVYLEILVNTKDIFYLSFVFIKLGILSFILLYYLTKKKFGDINYDRHVTFLCGRGGVYALGAVVANYRGDHQRRDLFLSLFLEVWTNLQPSSLTSHWCFETLFCQSHGCISWKMSVWGHWFSRYFLYCQL